MALEMIGWGAAIEDGDPRQLIVFISGYSRNANAPFHFAEYSRQFQQTKLFLRDGANCHYSQGIPGVTETEEENVAFLRYVIDRLSPERVTFVSGSVGTHPTVIWGCQLGVNDIHLIGPVTDLASGIASPRAGMAAFGPIRDYCAGLVAQGYPYTNLRTYLLEYGDRVDSIDVFYGLDDPTDIEQARNIADLPNVRSTVYYSGDHIRVPMFVQRRDRDLANRINLPIERPADLRSSGAYREKDLGYAAVRLE